MAGSFEWFVIDFHMQSMLVLYSQFDCNEDSFDEGSEAMNI
jgi:hypothetical protein